MTNDIYQQHDAAFNNVSAFVVLKDGERVATVAFKRGLSVTCYLHIIGLEMTKGRANGGGYDRQSAAAWDAVSRSKPTPPAPMEHSESIAYKTCLNALRGEIVEALKNGNGRSHWDKALRDAGFTVLQAV